MKALFDTNVVIDDLQGVPDAREELARFEHAATRAFLSGFRLTGLDRDQAERAVALRRRHRMNRPDAIIWAAAQSEDGILVTWNTRDFPAEDLGVRPAPPIPRRSGASATITAVGLQERPRDPDPG